MSLKEPTEAPINTSLSSVCRENRSKIPQEVEHRKKTKRKEQNSKLTAWITPEVTSHGGRKWEGLFKGESNFYFVVRIMPQPATLSHSGRKWDPANGAERRGPPTLNKRPVLPSSLSLPSSHYYHRLFRYSSFRSHLAALPSSFSYRCQAIIGTLSIIAFFFH